MTMKMINGLQGLKGYRQRAGMTQQKLADALGVERATVAMWETGRSWPSAALLPKIADLLLCSIDDLYHGPQVDDTEEKEVCPCRTTALISTEGTAELPA